MYKLEYLRIAIDDMNNIVYYVSNKLNNRVAAINLATEFIKEANNLLTFPYGNSEYIPINQTKLKYRRTKIKNFLMFYTINEDNKTITIVRVLHQKQSINKLFSDNKELSTNK